VGLITGPQRQAGAAHVGYPAVCGVYGPVRGHWAVRTSVVAHPGSQAACRPTVPVTILRVEWPAGRQCCHPVPIFHASAAERVALKIAVAGRYRTGVQWPGQ
jgi:hypothetical protein